MPYSQQEVKIEVARRRLVRQKWNSSSGLAGYDLFLNLGFLNVKTLHFDMFSLLDRDLNWQHSAAGPPMNLWFTNMEMYTCVRISLVFSFFLYIWWKKLLPILELKFQMFKISVIKVILSKWVSSKYSVVTSVQIQNLKVLSKSAPGINIWNWNRYQLCQHINLT